MQKILIISFSIIFIILLAKCESSISGSRPVVFPDSGISYYIQVEPLMHLKCSYSGCHSADAPIGFKKLDSYYNIMFSPENTGLIVPFKPDQSYFIQIVEGKLSHNPILSSNYINDNQKKGLRQWVNEGALEFPKK